MRKVVGERGKLKAPRGVKPIPVRYNMMHPLVCADHHEHGVLGACPHPNCPNGMAAAEEWIISQPPGLDQRVYRRTCWDMGSGSRTWTWEDRESLFMSVPRVFWREAKRAGWVPAAPADRCGYQYTSLEGFLGILGSGEL